METRTSSRQFYVIGKNEALVKYATKGLPQQVFVSKYLVNLPSEKQLKQIVEEQKIKESI